MEYVYAVTCASSLITHTEVNCPDSTADNIAKRPVQVLLEHCKNSKKHLNVQELCLLFWIKDWRWHSQQIVTSGDYVLKRRICQRIKQLQSHLYLVHISSSIYMKLISFYFRTAGQICVNTHFYPLNTWNNWDMYPNFECQVEWEQFVFKILDAFFFRFWFRNVLISGAIVNLCICAL